MPCAKCGNEDADKKCGKCFVTSYCSRECQQQHWKAHKKLCGKLANEYHERNKDGEGDDTSKTAEVSGAEGLAAPAPEAVNGAPVTSTTSSAAPSEAADETEKPVNSLSDAEASNGQSKAVTEAAADKPAAEQPIQGIPSKPYKAPAGLSELGQKIHTELKSVLEGLADKVGETLLETPFCESTGDNTRRVDTRVMFALHQLLQETLRADPESIVEVFKRMLAIKMMLKRPDDAAFASWASIVGQQCLVKAQELRLTAIKNSTVPKNPEGTIQLSKEVLEEVRLLHVDAVAILHLGNRFFAAALLSGKHEMLGKLSVDAAQRLHNILQRVADTTAEEKADPHSRALATYALAHDACQSEDKEKFETYIHQTRALWADMGNPTLPGFIERHINMGVCKACAAEMSGVMDGHEIRFKQFIMAQTRHGLAPSAASNGDDASSSGGKGARLVPGESSSEIEPASSSKAEPQARMTQASIAATRAGIAALEAEMKKGYELYEEGRMEAGVDHFAKVLKKAYELPLTGMSVSLIYSLSHAHIEGAAQIRRWGKAEVTVQKLKEIAEFADDKPIPHSIPTVADQLHLWWREKSANLFSRQRKFDKALDTLEGAVPHAEKVSKKAVAAVMILLSSAHVEAFLSGSPRADLVSLQEAVDRGIAALKADPPPVGGSAMEVGGGNRTTPAQQWAAQTKLELWIKVLPMMRSLEGEGLDIDKAEAMLLPLAEKFDLTVGETIFNAEQFLNNAMASNKGLGEEEGDLLEFDDIPTDEIPTEL